MRNLWPLLLVAGLIYFGSKSCNQPGQLASPLRSVTESYAGGPVRQMEHASDDLMDMGNAMPQGGGLSSKAMMDTARRAGK